MTEYISSPHHFRDLIDSVAWIDMKAEMMDMLEAVKEQMIYVDSEMEFRRFQGRAEVLRDIMVLPNVILGALEDAIVDKKLDEFDDDMEV